MPTFTRPPAAISELTLLVSVTPGTSGPADDLPFRFTLRDAAGAGVGRLSGGQRPFLTPRQPTNFENAASALFNQAASEATA